MNLEQQVLADKTEACLRRLGYGYLKNTGRTVVGFEVQRPCRFMVTIEDLSRPKFGYPLRIGMHVESAVRIMPTLGSGDPGPEVERAVLALTEELCSGLTGRKLEGLLALKSGVSSEPWGP